MVSYIPLVAAKNAAIRPTPMHGAFSTDAYSNGCATNAVANSFVPFLRTTAIQSWPGARSNALELTEYLSGSARTPLPSCTPRLRFRSGRSVHCQNHAKARLAGHHLRVGIRRLLKRDRLDHGGHAAQRTATERFFTGRGITRQGTFELAAPEYE